MLDPARGLNKAPELSRRDRQGANARSIEKATKELDSFCGMLLRDVKSGSLLSADCSDIYGRRWFNTSDGQAYLRRKARLEAFAATGPEEADFARYLGTTPSG